MTIHVTSTTDSAEGLAQVNGETAVKTDETASASADPTEKQDENGEESETSEKEGEGDSDETETLETKEDEDGEESKPKKKNGIQKRIDKLSKRAAEEAREKEFWKAEALKAKQSAEPKEEVDAPKAAIQATGKPVQDDFESFDDYLEALTDWKADQREQAREAKIRETKAQSEFENRVQTYRGKVKDFEKTHPDFRELVEEVGDMQLSPVLMDAILENEPEFHYELVKNIKELERINGLSAIQAAREIGKIEARIASAKSKPEEKKITTKAPTPIKTVGTGSTGGARKSIFDPDLSQAEYERLRAQGSANA